MFLLMKVYGTSESVTFTTTNVKQDELQLESIRVCKINTDY